jgi:hypothetical protein
MRTIDVEKDRHTGDCFRERAKVVEVGLLLESGLLAALEAAAREQGMTSAALVRRLIRDFLSRGGTDETEIAPSRTAESLSSGRVAAT